MQLLYTTSMPLILASSSPRRQAYLTELGIRFNVKAAEIDEQPLEREFPRQFVERMAVEKAGLVAEHYPGRWVVAADTVVSFEDTILGKPEDKKMAVSMLLRLAGRKHQVQTGICLKCKNKNVIDTFSIVTEVCFAPFGRQFAENYVETGESLDKAGAYAIQGLGALFVRSIKGSYTNVVGLPLHELLTILEKHGVIRLTS